MRLKEGESRKKQEKREELLSRQERYMSLNVSREVGRSRIDKFFKQKNIEHTLSYK
jgi:thymidine kinase